METAALSADMDERLAKVIAPIEWQIPPVVNVSTFEALPPAAKEREIKKAADTFASTGRNVFVHYTIPILNKRRELLLASGTTKKKYHKTAAQLWATLTLDDAFFWNQAAKELRMCMKQRILHPKGSLVHAGRLDERRQYICYAEKAVAAYLKLPPASLEIVSNDTAEIHEKHSTANEATVKLTISLDNLNLMSEGSYDIAHNMEELTFAKDAAKSHVHVEVSEHDAEVGTNEIANQTENQQLLDTLPDRFEFESHMLYSHFAHYDFDEVRKAEGRTQTMLLRHLAERFEKTGKILFYYYVVPRLCKQTYPPSKGHTVTSKAADRWRFLLGEEKEKWRSASATLKKTLGDGDVVGLETLQLDSLDSEVLRLHSLAQSAIQEHKLCEKEEEG